MKQASRLLWFVMQFAVVGLALAFLVVWWHPEWITPENDRPVVRVSQADTAPAQPAAAGTASSYARAVSRAGPAVVNIHAAKIVEQRRVPNLPEPLLEQLFGGAENLPSRRLLERTLGSGVTVSSDGYILTNHHVIEGAEEIQVALHDGRAVAANIVGTDPESDLAVLKVDASDLPAITLNAGGELAVGDIVLAIGNPYGIGQTVTMGIVSATGRSELNVATYENFIQTDAAINIGNSGGALINTRGELVGINTAVLNRQTGAQGISFAIPTDLAREVFSEIIEHGHVVRGWLGIESAELVSLDSSQRPQETRGVRVTAVGSDGPAARAGIRAGDVLVSLGDRPVVDTRNLVYRVGAMEPGARVSITGIRDGKEFQTEVVLGERPQVAELERP